MPSKTSPVRPRPGYIMVELTPDQRTMLERIVDARSEDITEAVSLASTVRALIVAEFKRRKLSMEGQ